jgi:hypothetical protein
MASAWGDSWGAQEGGSGSGTIILAAGIAGNVVDIPLSASIDQAVLVGNTAAAVLVGNITDSQLSGTVSPAVLGGAVDTDDLTGDV